MRQYWRTPRLSDWRVGKQIRIHHFLKEGLSGRGLVKMGVIFSTYKCFQREVQTYKIVWYTFIYFTYIDILYLNIINTHFHMESKILFQCKNERIMNMVVSANIRGWHTLCFLRYHSIEGYTMLFFHSYANKTLPSLFSNVFSFRNTST